MKHEIILQAIEAGTDMNQFLARENQALENRQIEQVEAELSRKTRLAGRMEKSFQQLNDQQEGLKQDSTLRSMWQQLLHVVEDYRKLVQENRLLLQAAHTSTADFLTALKQAVEAEKPKAATYGANGNVGHAGAGGTNLINKAV